MPGELWKGGYIFAARMLSMFLGMAFIVSRHPAYSWYADKGRTHGLSPLSDQQLAGGLMLSVDIIVMVAALAYFFWQAALTEDSILPGTANSAGVGLRGSGTGGISSSR